MQRDFDMAEVEMAIAGLEAARISEAEGGVAESPDGRSIAQLERFIESPPDYIRESRARRLGIYLTDGVPIATAAARKLGRRFPQVELGPAAASAC